MINFVELIFELMQDPRHRSRESLSIIYLKATALEELYLRKVGIKVFLHQRVIVLPIDCYAKLVLGRWQVVGHHL